MGQCISVYAYRHRPALVSTKSPAGSLSLAPEASIPSPRRLRKRNPSSKRSQSSNHVPIDFTVSPDSQVFPPLQTNTQSGVAHRTRNLPLDALSVPRQNAEHSLMSDDDKALLDEDDGMSEAEAFDKLVTPPEMMDELPDFRVQAILATATLQGAQRGEKMTRLLNLRGAAAHQCLNELQSWLDTHPHHISRRRILRLLLDIAQSSCELPKTLFVDRTLIDSREPSRLGSFADVFHGTWDGQSVALKRLRINDRGAARNHIHRKFCQESLAWRQLRHANVLTFIGMDGQTFKDTKSLAMITPWMERGTIVDYVQSDDYVAMLHCHRLITEVACGLEFLHAQDIIHGQLQGSNVLITDDEHACIADYGLALIPDLMVSKSSTSMDAASATRWLAPELLASDAELSRNTRASDVFSFGRLSLTICTTHPPYHGTSDMAAFNLVNKGIHPQRPIAADCGGYAISDELWSIMNECWATAPIDRPDMSIVTKALMSN